MSVKQVIIAGYDMTEFIIDIPATNQEKAEIGQLIINDTLSLGGDNSEGFWYISNPYSPFYSKDIGDLLVEIYKDSLVINSGYILNITADSKTAQIDIKTEIYDILNTRAIYISEIDTPANITKAILSYYGFDYDLASFNRSDDVHSAYGLTAQVNLSISDMSTMTVLDLLQQLSIIGVARLYYYKGKFYYEAYDSTYDIPVSVDITMSDIAIPIKTYKYEVEPVGSYQITYAYGDVSGGDSASTKPLKSISYGFDNPIRIMTSLGAIYIGESYLTLSSQDKVVAELGIYMEKGSVVSLRSGITITSTRLGWTSKRFEVVSIDNSHDFITQIKAISV